MGNENSGRGGIDFATFRRIERMRDSGIKSHVAARETGVDRKTTQKIYAGEHVFQQEGCSSRKHVQCPVCGHVVDELPCMFCSVAPLDITPEKVDPRTLVECLFERDETAEELYGPLVESIGQLGMIQPPLVVEEVSRGGAENAEGSEREAPRSPRLRVILGMRRVRAAVEAGLPVIWVGKVRCNRHRQYDALLTDEFLRVDRNPMERARMFAAALEDDAVRHTQKTLAARIGRSQSYVAQHVNLLKLPGYWRDLLITRVISVAHARHLVPHAADERLLAEVWRDLDRDAPPSVEAFRALVSDAVARLAEERTTKGTKGHEEEGPLDDLIPLRTPNSKRAVKEVKFRFAAETAEHLMLRLDVIGEAEDCQSREETLERLIDFYWEHQPDTGAAAKLGLRKVA